MSAKYQIVDPIAAEFEYDRRKRAIAHARRVAVAGERGIDPDAAQRLRVCSAFQTANADYALDMWRLAVLRTMRGAVVN